MAVFSFFSGSGFLDLGFEHAQFNINFVNEFSAEFLRAYRYARERMHTEEPEFGYYQGDINNLLATGSDLQNMLRDSINEVRGRGELVGFIGGPPCPDFSIAGRQQGRDGVNGQLSLSYVNLIIQMQPDFFLFENVKGLWSTSRHREYYDELVEMLHEAGFSTTDRLVNALAYGAPQDRERVLLFGMNRNTLGSRLDKHIEGNCIIDFPWEAHQMYDANEVKNNNNWPIMDDFEEHGNREKPIGIIETLSIQHWFDQNDVVHHPNANAYFTPRAGIERMRTIEEGDVRRKSYKRLHRWRYSPTAAYGNNEVHLHPYEARRLSAAEALAIQSLPSEFVLPDDMTLSNMFKTIGNGVPFMLSFGIAKTIRDYLEKI